MTLHKQSQSRRMASALPEQYARFTPSLAFQLAGPHTWVAAIMPVLLSYTYCAVSYSGNMNLLMALILLIICVCMQSAVNVLNDYSDYKKGTDTLENSSDDAFDAVLVYNNLNPKTVLAYAVGLLVVAAALGLYLCVVVGWPLLVIGLIGAAALVLYSFGKTPISYLPIGEFVSGIVMGGLIPLACCYALSYILEPIVLLVALPCIIGVGMVLFTNNTCDIEKDIEACRNTLAVKLGRARAPQIYKATILVWLISVVLLVAAFYSAGIPFLLIMVLAAFPTLRAIMANPLTQASRDGAMAQIVTLNVVIIAFYCVAIAVSTTITWF